MVSGNSSEFLRIQLPLLVKIIEISQTRSCVRVGAGTHPQGCWMDGTWCGPRNWPKKSVEQTVARRRSGNDNGKIRSLRNDWGSVNSCAIGSEGSQRAFTCRDLSILSRSVSPCRDLGFCLARLTAGEVVPAILTTSPVDGTAGYEPWDPCPGRARRAGLDASRFSGFEAYNANQRRAFNGSSDSWRQTPTDQAFITQTSIGGFSGKPRGYCLTRPRFKVTRDEDKGDCTYRVNSGIVRLVFGGSGGQGEHGQ